MTGDAPWILGISLSHNGAACLLRGNEIVVAVQEERLTRRKRERLDPDQPSLAVQYCLDYAGIGADRLYAVGVCSQPSLSRAMGSPLLEQQLAIKKHRTRLVTLTHHAGHAVHAFATSGFDEAAILVIDGLGSPAAEMSIEEKRVAPPGMQGRDSEAVSLYELRGGSLRPLEKHLVPNGEWLISRPGGMSLFRSLGGMYSAAARQIFGEAMDAGHVMGLAPYGTPEFPAEAFFRIVDGTIRFEDSVPALFSGDLRWPHHEERYRNLAASVQAALEQAILWLARRLAERTPVRNLCYAGGVALNITANERLWRETPFADVYIPAAAEDSGPAIGAAFWALWTQTGTVAPRRIHTDATGRKYGPAEIARALTRVPAMRGAASDDVLEQCAARIARGEIAGWFHGGSELGPRALGQRSILADPRDPETKDRLNTKVKFRQPFRPFAPAVLKEQATRWFDIPPGEAESEFMLRVWPVRPELRDKVPAICHVDGTARPQTIDRAWAPRFYALIERFHAVTGVPMLVNTSFNVRGEPIVETPEDALWCFLMTDMDFCVIEDRLVTKEQGRSILMDYRPKLVATDIAVEQTGDGREQAASIRCTIGTPWGRRRVHLAPDLIPLLRLADEKRSVRELGEAFRRDAAEPIADSALLDLLVSLRRCNVLQLSPPDS